MPSIPAEQQSPFGGNSADHVFLTAVQVRKRYGGGKPLSDVTLWRWLQDDDLRFPKPLRVRGYRYWRLSDLIAWENKRLAEAECAP